MADNVPPDALKVEIKPKAKPIANDPAPLPPDQTIGGGVYVVHKGPALFVVDCDGKVLEGYHATEDRGNVEITKV